VAPGLAAYSASKAAVVHLTRSLALEWARHGIRVNALEPGYIRTELTEELWDKPYGIEMIKRIPMRRLGTPEDLDGALLLLATPASAWMTGSVIAVDGGHLVSAL
jgi:NAD(P)-dependent dehydrogenase (short-subunit alcohol dehydrogenase family)